MLLNIYLFFAIITFLFFINIGIKCKRKDNNRSIINMSLISIVFGIIWPISLGVLITIAMLENKKDVV